MFLNRSGAPLHVAGDTTKLWKDFIEYVRAQKLDLTLQDQAGDTASAKAARAHTVFVHNLGGARAFMATLFTKDYCKY